MPGTLVNAAAIIAGSLIGMLLRRGLPEKIKTVIMQGLGLCIVLIGIRGAVQTENEMVVILSIVIGGLIGSLIGIEKGLDRMGQALQNRLSKTFGASDIGKGFVTASLIFCVGSMAIVGSLNAGLKGDYSMLYAKALLDGVTSMVLSSTLGPGVMLSALPILVYQGGITLLAGLVSPILSDRVVTEMSAVGGLLIIGIGLNMIYDKHLRVGDLLPAVFLPCLVLMVFA